MIYMETGRKKQLLCTFTKKGTIYEDSAKIAEKFDVIKNRIFVLKSDGKYILSYGIDSTNRSVKFPDNTILVHRKKDTNTLYSINALNYIIERMNNGVLDKNIEIPWENYQNMILLVTTNEDGTERLKQLHTELDNIIYTEEAKLKIKSRNKSK